MRFRILVWSTLALVLAGLALGPSEEPPAPLIQERLLDGRTHFYRFRQVKSVLVHLPPSYGKGRGRFPVLYVQDGRWVDQKALALMQAGRIREILIVSVASPSERDAQFSPVPDPQYGGGRAEEYARFLICELKPFIDRRYGTLPGPADTGLLGCSMGGLASLYTAWTHPSTFGLVGALSPSLWWADGAWTRQLAAGPAPDLRIWLDAGTEEEFILAGARDFAAMLRAKGYRDKLAYREVAGGTHDTSSWLKRTDEVLEFLFPLRSDEAGVASQYHRVVDRVDEDGVSSRPERS